MTSQLEISLAVDSEIECCAHRMFVFCLLCERRKLSSSKHCRSSALSSGLLGAFTLSACCMSICLHDLYCDIPFVWRLYFVTSVLSTRVLSGTLYTYSLLSKSAWDPLNSDAL